jgi:alanine dehydrogenase
LTLLLSDDDVRRVCNIGNLVTALEDGLRQEAKGSGSKLPERMNLNYGENFLRLMPAMLPELEMMGLKFFHGSLREGVRYVVATCGLRTGEIHSLVDAAYLTAARTGATSGLATKLLSRPDSSSVGLVGSGLEADTNLRAVCSVRGVTQVKVFSRSPDRRTAFAERMSAALQIQVVPAETPQEACSGTDIVVVATNTGLNGPVAFRGEWLEPGQHVVAIGSTAPNLREIDEQSFLRADLVAFDVEASQVGRESGDVAALLRADPDWSASVSLSDLLTGQAAARTDPDAVTLFKSVGSAAQDLIAAMHVVAVAEEQGIGTRVADIATPKAF